MCSSNFIAFFNTHFFSDLWHDIDQPLLLHERDDWSFRVAATGTVKKSKFTCWVPGAEKKALESSDHLEYLVCSTPIKTLLNFKFHIVLSPSRI